MINFKENLQSLKAFAASKQKKIVIVGGMIILLAITMLSCVSSFMIYKEGFTDFPVIFQFILSLLAVLVVEGCFLWLVYGFTAVFSSARERVLSFIGMWALASVMLLNIVTHFMMVKNVPLNDFQKGWLSWGATAIFIGILVLVLAIRLSDPIIRLITLNLRLLGKQEEAILQAKKDALETQKIRQAIADRAILEADLLAERIMYEGLPSADRYERDPLEERLMHEQDNRRYEMLRERQRHGLLNGEYDPND